MEWTKEVGWRTFGRDEEICHLCGLHLCCSDWWQRTVPKTYRGQKPIMLAKEKKCMNAKKDKS